MSVMDMFSLKGKVALVIGGSKGLGEGIAMGLVEAGAAAVVSSRNQADCDKAANGITEKTGGQCYGISADISTKDGVDALVEKVIDKLGHIDILVNSAGVNIRKPAIEYTVEDWDKVQDVQLKGVFLACQAVGKHMIEKGIKGKIINISSINARVVARPNIVSYVAAKGAVMQMTKALAVEWAQYGITVNAVAPGFFETAMTKVLFEDPETREEMFRHIPVKRFGNADCDLAGMVVYFASEASNYTTGQIIYIDGGYTSI